MSFLLTTHGDRPLGIFYARPNVRDDGSLRIAYAFTTRVAAGGSGRESREPEHPDIRLQQRCSFLLSQLDAAALRTGLAQLGALPDPLFAMPVWPDVLKGSQWADRIHTPSWLLRLHDGQILAGDSSLNADLEYAPLLFGQLNNQPDLAPWTREGGCVGDITLIDDSPWEMRLQINAAGTVGVFPTELTPNYTEEMRDRSETGRTFTKIGSGRERGIENQEVAFKWGQEAQFLLKSRNEIRLLLGCFAANLGRHQSMGMPWWFTPGVDTPGTPTTTTVRFANDKIELGFEGGAVARTTLAFWQVPWEVDPVDGEVAAQPARAFLYKHTLKVPVGPVSWYYTDYAQPITFGGNTYFPAKIEHDRLSQGYMLDDDPVTMSSFVADNHPWMLILRRIIEAPLGIEIYAVDPANPGDAQLRYSGDIGDAPSGRGRKLRAPTTVLGGLLEIKVPNFLVQEGCNHEFGDVGCGVDLGSVTVTATVVSTSGLEVVVSHGAGDEAFSGGDAEHGSGLTYEARDIVRSEDLGGGQHKLILERAFRNLPNGSTLTFRSTCNGTWAECKGYGNQINYGGHRHVGPDNISVPAREANPQGGKK